MRVDEFDYELAPERIAQSPAPRREQARLLSLERTGPGRAHHRIHDLPTLLRRGDLLVLNDTRVQACRLLGRKRSGGRVELLLVEPFGSRPHRWRALLRCARPPATGAVLEFDAELRATVIDREAEGWVVQLDRGGGNVKQGLSQAGLLPLPPYIRREVVPALDGERYQTVYARQPGAVAAPTAGLHFTDDLFEALKVAGVEIAFLTLHVGPGTFLPVRTAEVEGHRMHAERYELPGSCAAALDRARERGARIVAVGTTVVRCLEERATEAGRVQPGCGRSALFIHPGFRFRVVDALLTNFHLPRSTLLMLVCAFAGTERTLAAYADAVAQEYRFYSYGDAMLIS